MRSKRTIASLPASRQLHTQLNQELALRFGNTQADFDGPAYHFHLTVSMGGQPLGVYRKIYEELVSKLIKQKVPVDLTGTFCLRAKR